MGQRCRACGATNPDTATWCNQCLTDMALRDTAAPTARGRPRTAGPEVHPSPPTPDAAAFRRSGDRIEWRCPTCGDWSAMDDRACAHCRTPLRARMDAGAHGPEGSGRRVDPDTARTRTVVANAVLPGLGHLLLGWVGSGLARMVLFVVWLVGGLLLAAAGGLVAALPLFLGAAVLWLTGVFDGWQAVTGARQVLSGRALLWLVVAVTLLVTVSVVGAVMSGSS